MENLWLIGAGGIAKEYAKVLIALNQEFLVIGRGHDKAESFRKEINKVVIEGGIESYVKTNPKVPQMAIVAVNVENLAATTIALMEYGVKRIFCEKPGFNDYDELNEVVKIATKTESEVYYAYNRRFYASVLKAEEIIKEDGGMTSMNFEFTEWAHVIEGLATPERVKRNWLAANSSHVIDLAFFEGGDPAKMVSFSNGELSWHKPSRFVGAGKTKKDILFNYQANWEAPGRWSIEFLTNAHRIYLKPMEQLQLQDRGSVKVYSVEIEDELDKQFKPGFFLETKAFIENNPTRLCSLQQQKEHIENIYSKILGK